MFYAILGIIVVVALFLIFREDHDDSYNKSEKGQRKAQPKKEQTHYQKETGPKGSSPGSTSGPKAEKKTSAQSLKDQILGEIEQAISEAKKGAEEPMKVFGEVMGMAKEAVNTAMKEAQKGWNTTDTQMDVMSSSRMMTKNWIYRFSIILITPMTWRRTQRPSTLQASDITAPCMIAARLSAS